MNIWIHKPSDALTIDQKGFSDLTIDIKQYLRQRCPGCTHGRYQDKVVVHFATDDEAMMFKLTFSEKLA